MKQPLFLKHFPSTVSIHNPARNCEGNYSEVLSYLKKYPLTPDKKVIDSLLRRLKSKQMTVEG